jgi:hypothetical protein
MTEGRWYCVSRIGIATLCVDEEDARANAEQCDVAWPAGGPHRAVRLVDAVEVERLRAVIVDVVADAKAAVAAERKRCAAAVPTNWVDPLLTGPRSLVPATVDCRVIESLLQAVRARILDANAKVTG